MLIIGTSPAARAGPSNQHGELLGDLSVSCCRRWVYVVDALPHLVQEILAEGAPPLEQPLELHRLGIAHERRHVPTATARLVGVALGWHISPPL